MSAAALLVNHTVRENSIDRKFPHALPNTDAAGENVFPLIWTCLVYFRTLSHEVSCYRHLSFHFYRFEFLTVSLSPGGLTLTAKYSNLFNFDVF